MWGTCELWCISCHSTYKREWELLIYPISKVNITLLNQSTMRKISDELLHIFTEFFRLFSEIYVLYYQIHVIEWFFPFSSKSQCNLPWFWEMYFEQWMTKKLTMNEKEIIYSQNHLAKQNTNLSYHTYLF